jgi:hypothetical protein
MLSEVCGSSGFVGGVRDLHYAAQRDIRALVCRAVILSAAKNLAPDFSAGKEQGEMLRGVYPE